GGNEPPAQIVAADRLPLGNGGTVGQAALVVQDQPAGFILELINRGRVQVDGGNAAGEEPHAAPEAARARGGAAGVITAVFKIVSDVAAIGIRADFRAIDPDFDRV